MKNAYTLISLVSIILIIGILTSVAAPHLNKLKQNAQAYSVIKVAMSTFCSTPSAYVNMVDLENEYTDKNITLKSLIGISGYGWSYPDDNKSIYKENGNSIVTIELGSNRDVNISINCQNFRDKVTRDKCESQTDNDSSKDYQAIITF